MKKLMMAIAVVALAAASQGAALTWKWTSTLYDGYNSGAEGYTGVGVATAVYLFNANEVTQQAILSAGLTGGTIPTGTGLLGSYTTSDGKAPSAAMTIADPTSSYTGATRSSSGSTYIDYFYAALVKSGEDTYVFLSDTKNGQVQASKNTALSASLSASKSLVLAETPTFSGQNWYGLEPVIPTPTPTPTPTPEPTSGLLLLLGVAGMALCRRRA